jgi:hypothetical protein
MQVEDTIKMDLKKRIGHENVDWTQLASDNFQ